MAQAGTKSGQEAAGQMGISVCQKQPGPGKHIPNQTLNQTDQLDAFQRVLPGDTPHMYDDMKAHLQVMLDIGAICKLHSPWASTVVPVQKKDGSLRFCIKLRKLNNLSSMRTSTACRVPVVLLNQPEVLLLTG